MSDTILHFIWVGDNIPSYALKNIEQFKIFNPSSKINFVHIHDDLSMCDGIVLNLLQQIKQGCGKYRYAIEYYRKLGRRTKQILSNILRYELLNLYGGIYLDCDCFPIRSFDKSVVDKSFVVSRCYRPNGMIRKDCYFIGKNKNDPEILFYNTCGYTEKFDPGISNIDKLVFRKNMDLSKINTPNFYFIHANMEEWNKW